MQHSNTTSKRSHIIHVYIIYKHTNTQLKLNRQQILTDYYIHKKYADIPKATILNAMKLQQIEHCESRSNEHSDRQKKPCNL